MDNFNKFLSDILKYSGASLKKKISINETRLIISKINEFFYTHHESIGKTNVLGQNFEYFSEFHKFWEQHHRKILNPELVEKKCASVADVLHNLFIKYDKKLFYGLYDTASLNPEEICRVRYFSANQDFRSSMKFIKLAEVYINDPSIFDKEVIYDNPEDFLQNIGVTSLSQNDKRIQFAKKAAELLINKKIEPYDLIKICDNDINKVKKLLFKNKGSGFGNKKIDMFLRDMVILNVWTKVKGFDKIDVASDINTIRVALRTGIFKTDIVLLSSFLDIFCYQYGLIDEISALAWRRVWEIWQKKYPKECIPSPCLIDYFVYRIVGQDFCKEKLCVFECETKKHTFKWHSSRNRTCQICFKKHIRHQSYLVQKSLPCMDDDGYISIIKSPFVSGKNKVLPGIKECPFASVCLPKNADFKKFDPPKSISILGRTGWDSARARKKSGGGGLMS